MAHRARRAAGPNAKLSEGALPEAPHASLCRRPRRQRTHSGGPVPLCAAAQAEAAVRPPLDRADDSVCFHVRQAALEALKMGSSIYPVHSPS